MKQRSTALAILFLLSCSISHADTCIELPFKPVRHLCGIVTNQLGERLSNATVTLLKAGVEIKTIQTGANGSYEFGKLEAGDYEVRARLERYHVMQHPIKIVRPTATCRKQQQIILGLSVCSTGISQLRRPIP